MLVYSVRWTADDDLCKGKGRITRKDTYNSYIYTRSVFNRDIINLL